jgi:hypothetical protein
MMKNVDGSVNTPVVAVVGTSKARTMDGVSPS